MAVSAQRVLEEVLDALGLLGDDDTTEAGRAVALTHIADALEACDEGAEAERDQRTEDRAWRRNAGARS